jgi:hypothetical protein
VLEISLHSLAAAKECALPLASWKMGATKRIDEAQAPTAHAFQPHHLEPSSESVDFRIHRAPLGSSALTVVVYGVGVQLECPGIQDFYVEHFVTRGAAEITQDGRAAPCASGRGVLMSPSTLASLRLTPDCVTVGIRIARERLETHLELITGRPVHTPIVFEDRVDMTRGSGARRHRLAHSILAELERCASLGGSPLAASLEEAYLTSLLTAHPHSHRALVDARAPDAGTRGVRLVEEYIHSHPEKPVRSEILVALSGVSASALYEAFQRERGVSPMRMLREVRLERVRKDLLPPTFRRASVRDAAAGASRGGDRRAQKEMRCASSSHRARHQPAPRSLGRRTR